mmetsp:Transcript_21678/g.45414  ORF Transcript_21678/g.45414 Transcript_21678/m.45414 type:complete len:535 (+) Transcript_21678:1414-3018(+)
MKDYEILSRATAFLLQVDPPDPSENDEQQPNDKESKSHDAHQGFVKKTAFPHLKENMELRKKLLRKQDYKYDPAGGPPRLPHQLNWLEFCPTAFRPKVHVVSSSHVISPWLWPKYYGQDWLRVITQEHVRYSLEVWGKSSGGSGSEGGEGEVHHDGKLRGSFEPLAKFALNPYPIHHPNDMDVAVIHLKQEETALEHLTSLGIQPLHLPTMHDLETSNDPVFEPGERVLFQGFEVYEANTTDQESLTTDKTDELDGNDDERVFHPYSSLGTLAMASPDRFLAQTKAGPLPEGLCGGPAIQLPKEMTFGNNRKKDIAPMTVRGVVEGIVSSKHEDERLAGMASILPSYRVREFVDYAERLMLEQIIDEDLFKRVVELKEKKDHRGTTYSTRQDGEVHEINDSENDGRQNERNAEEDDDELPNDPNLRSDIEGTSSEDADTPHMDSEYQAIVASLHERHTPEEVDAILATVDREREEVIRIMETKGGDLDDVVRAVRRKTYEEKDRVMAEIEKEMMGQKGITEGEIVSSYEDEKKS